MKGKTNLILAEVLNVSKPSTEELKIISSELKNFLNRIKQQIKKSKINASTFVGGSAAKGTMVKKDHYDIDIFVKFKGYENSKLSDLTEKLLRGFKFQRIRGSRDYFHVKVNNWLFFEIIPVKKIKNPKEAENITDLSYFHVNYINKKIKNQRTLDEIILAKAFCYANRCYGAESYINGFSGYGLELLVYHYKTFLNFIKTIVKFNGKDKLVIDIEKHYKNKSQVLLDINSAKLQSPIILIDPTYKQRNVLAALSYETFKNFQEACKQFLKNPSVNAFETKKIRLEAIKRKAKKGKNELIILKATTDKQEGDIAGSKLIKFYRYLKDETAKFFDIKDCGFEYSGKKTAMYFFIVKKKPQIITQGPQLKDKENVRKFKRNHKHTFNKKGRVYAKEKISQNIKDFLNTWEQKNKRIISDMSIKELRVIG